MIKNRKKAHFAMPSGSVPVKSNATSISALLLLFLITGRHFNGGLLAKKKKRRKIVIIKKEENAWQSSIK